MWRLVALGAGALLLVLGAILVFIYQVGRQQQVQNTQYGLIKLPLNTISSNGVSLGNADSLRVNGQLQVTSSIALTPASQPTNPQAGQLYYDQSVNQLAYYNGQSFTYVTGGGSSTTNNTFVTNGGATTNTVNVTNVQAGAGGVSVVNGAAGSVALFSDTNTLTASLLTQVGSTLTTNASLQVHNAGNDNLLNIDVAGNNVSIGATGSSATPSTIHVADSNGASQTVKIGSATGSSSTAIQGGTGGVAINAGGASSFTTTSGALMLSSGDNNLVLEGGNSATNGSVIVRPQSGSAKAFQVQNTAGNAALSVDSTNGIMTLNTASNCGYSNYTAYLASLTPAAYWRLEDTGTTAADSSGNNNTGTLSNVTTNQTPGPFSCDMTHSAMAFSGNGQITTTTSAVAPGNYSEVVMFKTTGTGVLVGYTDAGGGNNDRHLYVGSDGKLYTRFWNTTASAFQSINSPTTVNDGNWHIAVATESSTSGLSLYLDGSLVASNAAYTSPQSYTGKWIIGNISFMNPFTGQIGQVAVFNSALNALQVQTLSTYSGFYTASLAAFGVGTTAPAANLDVEGTALFKNGVDSTTAFQIQNSSGAHLLTADTSNMAIDVKGSLVVQNSAGSATLLNVNAAGNTVSLGTGAGSALGYSGVGSNLGGGSGNNMMSAQKVTTTAGGTITSMFAYLGADGVCSAPNNQFQFAIYADNGSGAPGSYITSSTIGTLSTPGAWYTLPISATLSPSTVYWLAYWHNSNCGGSLNDFAYNNVPGAVAGSTPVAWQSGSSNGWPSTFPSFGTVAAVASLYATYASSGPALSLNSSGTLTQNGASVFQDPTDSASAFQIQNSAGNTLLAADTVHMTVTVKALIVSTDITVNGHVITGGNTPSIAAGAGACTSPTVSISGNDTSGTITVNTGTGCSGGGTLATITFANAFGSAPHVVLTPGSPISQTLGAYVDDSTISTTKFDLGTNATPLSSQTFKWNYWTAQ